MQNKRRKNKASKFIPNLHKILADKESGAYWRQDNKSFVLNDFSKLISNSLPKYFRHSNISSFIRQLNLYGFKKLVGEQIQENTYFHEKFKKNYITQLKPIRSFYNQQKYGRMKKAKNASNNQVSMESIQSNEQQDCQGKTSGFSDSESEICYKQKIAILQKQNQRLRAVQQEHIQLLNLLNSTQKTSQLYQQYINHIDNNVVNMMQESKVPPSIYMQPSLNSEYELLSQVQNQDQNFSYYQNAYYIPFQSIL